MQMYIIQVHGKVVDVSPDLQSYTRHEPFGVVGQIIPWNVPSMHDFP